MRAVNRLLCRVVIASAGAIGIGCGDDEPTTFCCALERLCNACECETRPEFRNIAQSKDEEACRFVLEDNDLGCTSPDESETDAVAACVNSE